MPFTFLIDRSLIYLEHERISNLCLRNVVSIRVANLHRAGGWGTCVSDCARRGESAHVETQLQVVLASLVETRSGH